MVLIIESGNLLFWTIETNSFKVGVSTFPSDFWWSVQLFCLFSTFPRPLQSKFHSLVFLLFDVISSQWYQRRFFQTLMCFGVMSNPFSSTSRRSQVGSSFYHLAQSQPDITARQLCENTDPISQAEPKPKTQKQGVRSVWSCLPGRLEDKTE